MRVRVFFHDKCFDGAASAAVFSRFYQARINSQARFEYSGLAHRASQLFDESKFDGEENAIVIQRGATGELEVRSGELGQQSEVFAPQAAEVNRLVTAIDEIALAPDALPAAANA